MHKSPHILSRVCIRTIKRNGATENNMLIQHAPRHWTIWAKLTTPMHTTDLGSRFDTSSLTFALNRNLQS